MEKKKSKINIVCSSSPKQRKKIFYLSNSQEKKGVSISKNIGKSIDKLYKTSDWDNDETNELSVRK